MSIVNTGQTELDQEIARWNKPYVFTPYPRMLYRGLLKSNGSTQVDQRIVASAGEQREAEADRWVESPSGATEQVETVQQEISQAAAEANAAATKMSWKAQRERKAREDATDKHLPE